MAKVQKTSSGSSGRSKASSKGASKSKKKNSLPAPHPQRGGVEMVDPLVRAQMKLYEEAMGLFHQQKFQRPKQGTCRSRAHSFTHCRTAHETFFRTESEIAGRALPAWRGHDEPWPMGRSSRKFGEGAQAGAEGGPYSLRPCRTGLPHGRSRFRDGQSENRH